jgi:hypothetical protein
MADSSVETIVVEHRDRFARFGAECVEAALSAPKPAIRLRVPPEGSHEAAQHVLGRDVATPDPTSSTASAAWCPNSS